jgi:hypothetical protein
MLPIITFGPKLTDEGGVRVELSYKNQEIVAYIRHDLLDDLGKLRSGKDRVLKYQKIFADNQRDILKRIAEIYDNNRNTTISLTTKDFIPKFMKSEIYDG